MGLTERHWFEDEDVPENSEWALEDAVYNSRATEKAGMTKLEKVIKGFEMCINKTEVCTNECPYWGDSWYCTSELMIDALKLLKNQGLTSPTWKLFHWEPGKNDVEYIKLLESSRDEWQTLAQKTITKLTTLSKAQEPIPCGEKIKAGDVMLDFYECGYCKHAIRKPWKYCPFCGKEVKWDG